MAISTVKRIKMEKVKGKLGMVNHACNPSYVECGHRWIMIQGCLGKVSRRPYQKDKLKSKKTRGMAQVVENCSCLIPGTTKKEEESLTPVVSTCNHSCLGG
jgi:hypothetical protein